MTPFELLYQIQLKRGSLCGLKRSFEDSLYRHLLALISSGNKLSQDEESYIARYEEAEEICKIDGVPITQSRCDYVELKDIKEQLDYAISKTKFKPISGLFVGTIESFDPNAFIVPAAQPDKYLVLLHSGLMSVITSLSTVIAYSSILKHSCIIQGVDYDRMKQAKGFFVDAIKKYLLFITEEENFDVISLAYERDRLHFARQLDQSAKRFVLGHEYSHLLLGHLTSPGSNECNLINLDFVARLGDWRYWRSNMVNLGQEFEADTFLLFP